MARTRASSTPATQHGDALPKLSGLAPVIGPGARLLVLGSFPGLASLQAQQYYAHPRNQFWPILSALWGLRGSEALQSQPYAERLPVAIAHGLAIWDVYAQCQRQGSLDSAIENAQLNDLASLMRQTPTLHGIAHNGGESARHMKLTQALGLTVFKLPSTSPAHASWPFERKLAAWRAVFEDLDMPGLARAPLAITP
jgi:hypoxanthine-DNA glycosylase